MLKCINYFYFYLKERRVENRSCEIKELLLERFYNRYVEWLYYGDINYEKHRAAILQSMMSLRLLLSRIAFEALSEVSVSNVILRK